MRSFNQQGAETLVDPRFGDLAAANFVAGDDDGTRSLVVALAADVGLDAIDAGPLSSARYLEPLTLLWISVAQALGSRHFGLALLRRAPSL